METLELKPSGGHQPDMFKMIRMMQQQMEVMQTLNTKVDNLTTAIQAIADVVIPENSKSKQIYNSSADDRYRQIRLSNESSASDDSGYMLTSVREQPSLVSPRQSGNTVHANYTGSFHRRSSDPRTLTKDELSHAYREQEETQPKRLLESQLEGLTNGGIEDEVAIQQPDVPPVKQIDSQNELKTDSKSSVEHGKSPSVTPSDEELLEMIEEQLMSKDTKTDTKPESVSGVNRSGSGEFPVTTESVSHVNRSGSGEFSVTPNPLQNHSDHQMEDPDQTHKKKLNDRDSREIVENEQLPVDKTVKSMSDMRTERDTTHDVRAGNNGKEPDVRSDSSQLGASSRFSAETNFSMPPLSHRPASPAINQEDRIKSPLASFKRHRTEVSSDNRQQYVTFVTGNAETNHQQQVPEDLPSARVKDVETTGGTDVGRVTRVPEPVKEPTAVRVPKPTKMPQPTEVSDETMRAPKPTKMPQPMEVSDEAVRVPKPTKMPQPTEVSDETVRAPKPTKIPQPTEVSEPVEVPVALEMSESLGGLRNNQCIPRSGFKNEHGHDDNRFLPEAHDDGNVTSGSRRGRLSNIQVIRYHNKQSNSPYVTGDSPEKPRDMGAGAASASAWGRMSTSNKEPEAEVNTYVSDAYLQEMIQKQHKEASEYDGVKSHGMDTVICLDTSDSMNGHPLQEAKVVIGNILQGLEQAAVDHYLEENVALVTFGKSNQVLQHLTNDYDTLKDHLDGIEAGGPSPLFLGLALSLTEASSRGGVCKMSNDSVLPRIIVITDGFATTKNILFGPDYSDIDRSADNEVVHMLEKNRDEVSSSVECITVGKHNKDLLSRMSGGRVYTAEDVVYLSQVFRARDLANTLMTRCSEGSLSDQDILESIKNAELHPRAGSEVFSLVKSKISSKTTVPSSSREPTVPASSQSPAPVSNQASGTALPQSLNQPAATAASPSPSTVSRHSPIPAGPAQSRPPATTVNQSPIPTGTPNQRPVPTPGTSSEPAPSRSPMPEPRPAVRGEVAEPVSMPSVDISAASQFSMGKSLYDDSLEPATPDIDEVEELAFGSRVKANPDWTGFNSRENLSGTVLSPRKKGQIKVLWSDGTKEKRIYGVSGKYEVVPAPGGVTTQREDDSIDVGTLIQRGPDWRWGDQDGGAGNIGVVEKVDLQKRVLIVTWSHGRQGNYRYGYNKKYDVQPCVLPEITRGPSPGPSSVLSPGSNLGPRQGPSQEPSLVSSPGSSLGPSQGLQQSPSQGPSLVSSPGSNLGASKGSSQGPGQVRPFWQIKYPDGWRFVSSEVNEVMEEAFQKSTQNTILIEGLRISMTQNIARDLKLKQSYPLNRLELTQEEFEQQSKDAN